MVKKSIFGKNFRAEWLLPVFACLLLAFVPTFDISGTSGTRINYGTPLASLHIRTPIAGFTPPGTESQVIVYPFNFLINTILWGSVSAFVLHYSHLFASSRDGQSHAIMLAGSLLFIVCFIFVLCDVDFVMYLEWLTVLKGLIWQKAFFSAVYVIAFPTLLLINTFAAVCCVRQGSRLKAALLILSLDAMALIFLWNHTIFYDKLKA